MSSESTERDNEDYYKPGGWVNILFSFLTILSAAIMISWLTGNTEPEIRIAFTVLISTVFTGVLYFRSKINLSGDSPAVYKFSILAELLLYILYLGLTSSALIIKSAVLILMAAAAGLLLLVAMDTSVYRFPGRKMRSFFHSGQAFLTGLLIASFLSGMKLPFLFVAVIKLISGIYYTLAARQHNIYLSLRILRISLLIAAGITIFWRFFYSDTIIICLFLSGEFIDRILFYNDLNILHSESDK